MYTQRETTLLFCLPFQQKSILKGTNFPDATYKFQGNWPSGSGEKDFFKVFTIYGHGGHLRNVTWTKSIIFFPPLPGCCIWNLIETGPVASDEKSFENVDRQLTKQSLTKVTKWPWPTEFLRGWIWMHFYIKEHNSNRKSHFFNFFYSKALETKFDLAIK